MTDTAPSESNVSALDALASGESKQRKREPKSAGKSSSRPTGTRTAPLERRLAQSFTSIGVLVIALGDNVCGTAVVENAQMNAANVKELCDQNPKVRAAVEKMMEGGMYGKVFFGFAVTLLPVLRHHNLLPFAVGNALDKQEEHAANEENPEPNGISREAEQMLKDLQAKGVPTMTPDPDQPIRFID